MFEHFSVLKEEAVEGLSVKADGTYVDCTLGGGGHSEKIVSQLGANGLLLAFDQDQKALAAAQKRLEKYSGRVKYIHSNFRNLKEELVKHEINQVDGILFDLGVSSPQLDDSERGFSYQYDAALDMRMDQSQDFTAYQVINEWPYEQLVKIFFRYGEEKFSKQIARKIEERRKTAAIETTFELVDIIKEAIPAPARRKGGHPAKRIFQAVRIAVNDELNAFDDALHQAADVINIGGRLSVITFHSLEDRLCKQAFKKWSTTPQLPRNIPIIPEESKPPFRQINRKPILPEEAELDVNRRSRSAKLRIIEKLKPWTNDYNYQEGWNK
ncbi:16S rRNA (cytosine(1402)-N(4))-methyltransferase RsmH [Sediminibacillus albus]|uniref:Ribosomal RNA small subunit methyltransferase H n=1 Tax=Sediminibacillus albus TaxID=407036 RepID=A0A1G8W9U5_9BACI|nr:16S rRNA (cytosine(1402)-N(4))-methyltransferase RsmH [Sediminibacillus albus]SDJ74330.1 16S rRNA (cytosine1402-N4)-methyltransferase [Sediminibacillus albus]